MTQTVLSVLKQAQQTVLNGWCQGDMVEGDKYCLVGAIFTQFGYNREEHLFNGRRNGMDAWELFTSKHPLLSEVLDTLADHLPVDYKPEINSVWRVIYYNDKYVKNRSLGVPDHVKQLLLDTIASLEQEAVQ